MTANPKISSPRARRVSARRWARDVVGALPADVARDHPLDARMTAYASHMVASACLKVRVREGAPACRTLLENVILSAAHVASGTSGEAPSKVLRDLADALDEPLAPTVGERANA